MSLVALIHDKNWQALEEEWSSLMLQDGPLDDVYAALRYASDHKSIPRCMPLVREHADALADKQPADAAQMLGIALLAGGNPGELVGPLFKAVTKAWGDEDWYAPYAELAGLHENVQDMRQAWRMFSTLLKIEPGTAIVHSKGWGVGEITDLDRPGLEVAVKFKTGRRDRLPIKSAVEIFEVLPEEDLRSLVVKNPDELARLLREEPLEVLRNVLMRFRGRAGYAVIKGALFQLGVEGSSFSGWWRRVRKHAEGSPWFEISGTATKAQVQLNLQAADPAESLRRTLRLTHSLRKVHSRVRDLLAGGHVDDGMRAAALETVEAMAIEEGHPEADKLACWVLLREHREGTPEPLAERLSEAAAAEPPSDPSQAPQLWELFGMLNNSRDQERCVQLLHEIIPDEATYKKEVVTNLQHAAPGMVRPLLSELMEAKQGTQLVAQYVSLLARPSRNPTLLVALAALAENGKIEGDMPIPAHRAQSLIRLAVHLEANRIGDTSAQRAQTKLSALLTEGSPNLLKKLLKKAGTPALRSAMHLAERGVDSPLEGALTNLVAEIAPEIFQETEKPFWETGLWTTKIGLQLLEDQLRELVEVKLPENSEAIGKAASYGDLSENSEWEAAIEDQRNLTTRAAEIEADLRSVQLLENATLPADVVSPGKSVKYRDLASGKEKTLRILGPWDTVDDDIISYRAPLAAGLLGARSGDTVQISLPAGDVEVLLLEVDYVKLG